MGRQINNSKSKRVAHTQHDNRYNRGNKVTMIKCPKCCAISTLKIFWTLDHCNFTIVVIKLQ